MTATLAAHLGTLRSDLAEAIDSTYRSVMDHFLKEQWDDAQVDAGRFCEAALRYLEFKSTGAYTPIDGKSKPNRKSTVQMAIDDTALPPSLRAQFPQSIELTMDFRNNRNSAHLGNIDANKLDATCVVQTVNWMAGEIVRLEAQSPPAEVQRLLDKLAERHVPLVQTVNGRPVVLSPEMSASDKALVLLYHEAGPIDAPTLRDWVGYGNSTRWRTAILKGLQKRAYVYINGGDVTLLRPGEARAQELILALGGL